MYGQKEIEGYMGKKSHEWRRSLVVREAVRAKISSFKHVKKNCINVSLYWSLADTLFDMYRN